MMAGNGGVTTRLQSRKLRESQARQNSKRKSSKEMFVQRNEENMHVVVSGIHSRRSFPPESESDQWPVNGKNVSRTESSVKERRALCDRGDNHSRHDSAPFRERQQQHFSDDGSKSADKVSSTWKDIEVYSDCFHENPEQEYMNMTGMFEGCSTPLPMDTDMSIFLPTRRPGVPDEVQNIDSCPDSVTTTTYSQDIMEYLMWIETRDLPKPGFLDNRPVVNSKMRGVLMDWLLQVQNHEDLKDETLHLCVALVDSFLSLVEVKMPRLQLVGITCLLIACKFNERFAPEVSTLCYLTDNTFKRKEVVDYERVVLETLQFKLARAVSVTFLDRYLQVHKSPPQVECMARYLLDLSLTSVSLVSVLPSVKASSALYLSRLLMLDSSTAWTPDLIYYTNYVATEFQNWTTEFIQLLAKAPDSKFQGARGKYNSAEYCYISYSERAKPEWLLHKKCG